VLRHKEDLRRLPLTWSDAVATAGFLGWSCGFDSRHSIQPSRPRIGTDCLSCQTATEVARTWEGCVRGEHLEHALVAVERHRGDLAERSIDMQVEELARCHRVPVLMEQLGVQCIFRASAETRIVEAVKASPKAHSAR